MALRILISILGIVNLYYFVMELLHNNGSPYVYVLCAISLLNSGVCFSYVRLRKNGLKRTTAR